MIDERTGRLCWVDIVEGMLYEHELQERLQVTAAPLPTMLGAIAPRADRPGFAAAVADGFGYYASGQLTVTDRALPEPHRRMNDAKCDSAGRLWAGSTHMAFVPGVGALHRWDGESPSVILADGFTLPNGLGWDQDDTRMYLIDSMTNCLLSAAYEADEGLIGEFARSAESSPGCPTASPSTSMAVSGWRCGLVRRCAVSTGTGSSLGSFRCR